MKQSTTNAAGPMDRETLAAFIASKRKEAGLTQEELAKRLFVTNTAVSKWERGLSYPDILLVPGICRELNISEHEFFTACEDVQARMQKKQAKSWCSLVRGWQTVFYAAYGISLAICFICNLAGSHRLDWFWIVLASIGMAFCATNLPVLVKRDRVPVCLLAASGCLLLLLLFCGVWSAALVTGVCLLLPWGVYAAWRHSGKQLAVWNMGIFTGWLYLLLGVISGVGEGGWFWSTAFPVVTFCCLLLWVCFAACRWLPVNAWIKSSVCTGVAAAALPLVSVLVRIVSPESGEDFRTLAYYFDWRNGLLYYGADGSILGDRALFAVLLLAAAVLLGIGMVCAIRKRKMK